LITITGDSTTQQAATYHFLLVVTMCLSCIVSEIFNVE